MASPSEPTQQYFDPPRVEQGTFQDLLFFKFTQQYHKGRPLQRPPPLRIILRHEIIPKPSVVIEKYHSTMSHKLSKQLLQFGALEEFTIPGRKDYQ